MQRITADTLKICAVPPQIIWKAPQIFAQPHRKKWPFFQEKAVSTAETADNFLFSYGRVQKSPYFTMRYGVKNKCGMCGGAVFYQERRTHERRIIDQIDKCIRIHRQQPDRSRSVVGQPRSEFDPMHFKRAGGESLLHCRGCNVLHFKLKNCPLTM